MLLQSRELRLMLIPFNPAHSNLALRTVLCPLLGCHGVRLCPLSASSGTYFSDAAFRLAKASEAGSCSGWLCKVPVPGAAKFLGSRPGSATALWGVLGKSRCLSVVQFPHL